MLTNLSLFSGTLLLGLLAGATMPIGAALVSISAGRRAVALPILRAAHERIAALQALGHDVSISHTPHGVKRPLTPYTM